MSRDRRPDPPLDCTGRDGGWALGPMIETGGRFELLLMFRGLVVGGGGGGVRCWRYWEVAAGRCWTLRLGSACSSHIGVVASRTGESDNRFFSAAKHDDPAVLELAEPPVGPGLIQPVAAARAVQSLLQPRAGDSGLAIGGRVGFGSVHTGGGSTPVLTAMFEASSGLGPETCRRVSDWWFASSTDSESSFLVRSSNLVKDHGLASLTEAGGALGPLSGVSSLWTVSATERWSDPRRDMLWSAMSSMRALTRQVTLRARGVIQGRSNGRFAFSMTQSTIIKAGLLVR